MIGKALDGIESTQESGTRFQDHPPKSVTVELMLLDGSVEVLHQDWVKWLTQKHVFLGLVIIVIGKLMFVLEIARITSFTFYQTSQIAMQVIVLNNHFSSLSKILKKLFQTFIFKKLRTLSCLHYFWPNKYYFVSSI